MKVQVVTFGLNGLSDEAFRTACEEQWAATVAGMPGLVSKTWLANAPANRYGGVYIWEDEAALDTYVASDFFRGLAADPRIEGLESRSFDVLAEPTRRTNGLGIVAAR